MHPESFKWVKGLTADITNPETVWETLFGLTLWSDEEEQHPRTFWIRWQNDTQSVVCARNMVELCDLVDSEGDVVGAAFCELTPWFQLTQNKKTDPLTIDFEGETEEGTPVNERGEPAFIPLCFWNGYQTDAPLLKELIGPNPADQIITPTKKPKATRRTEAYRDRRKYLVEYRRRNKERLLEYAKTHRADPLAQKRRHLYRQKNRAVILSKNKDYAAQTKRWRLPVDRLTAALQRARRAGKPTWVTDTLQLRLDKAKETLALKLAKRKYNKRYKRLNAAKLQQTKTAKKEAVALLQVLATGQALQTASPN